jgi:hypothetical protein
MPIDRKRYPSNWSDIALSVKEKAAWRCRHCHRQCLRPGEKSKDITRSEWTKATLCVHHANFIPEDNRLENLIPLCTPCHLAMHSGCRGNISPGQLSLFSLLPSDWVDPLLQHSEQGRESFKNFDDNLAVDSSFLTDFPQ